MVEEVSGKEDYRKIVCDRVFEPVGDDPNDCSLFKCKLCFAANLGDIFCVQKVGSGRSNLIKHVKSRKLLQLFHYCFILYRTCRSESYFASNP
jgi:hypothetical protein